MSLNLIIYIDHIRMNSEENIKREEWKDWHENGQLWSHNFYKNGQLDGVCRFWYSNGQIYMRELYRNGKREGIIKMFHKNGNPYLHTFYRDAEMNGLRKVWYSNGNPAGQEFYRNGTLIDVNFTWRKKRSILRVRKSLQNSDFHPINTFLISDLGKTAYW